MAKKTVAHGPVHNITERSIRRERATVAHGVAFLGFLVVCGLILAIWIATL